MRIIQLHGVCRLVGKNNRAVFRFIILQLLLARYYLDVDELDNFTVNNNIVSISLQYIYSCLVTMTLTI
jgi:hypothetical protein